MQGIPGTVVYLDDILITGRSTEEHLKNLDAILGRLDRAGLRLKLDKCAFMQKEVNYLGHRIDASGLYPNGKKLEAIKAAPQPTNVAELRSYLGLINYYGRFLPGLATKLAPLYRLLRQGVPWTWNEEHQAAFETSKENLQSDKLLVHFDPKLELTLACDASPYGLGAVLSHRFPDGSDRPVAFASRSLAPPEKNYAQIDKEALAIGFGVRKFHQYLYGRAFTIYTDHKQLITLLGVTKGVPMMASGRMQRWALTLAGYNYTLTYRQGTLNANADALSRLPAATFPASTCDPYEAVLAIHILESTSDQPVTTVQLRRWTERDPILAKVRHYVLSGWPRELDDPALQPYWNRRYELSVLEGCVLWGARVVVPPQARERVLKEHVAHPGSSRMKSLARSYVWWPKLDQMLERVAKLCDMCQAHRKTPPESPLHPWVNPERPWARLHIDFAGPFLGRWFLILVDAFSKWLEVHSMKAATSLATVKVLQSIFATHGLPNLIVTDNGSVFTSAEFGELMKRNGIKHVTSSPYHPASNGLAERAVQTFKEGMKKIEREYGSVERKVDRFLFTYRLTPHATTG